MEMRSKEAIVQSIIEELSEALESIGAGQNFAIIHLDEESQSVTIKMDYNIVEEDEYVGLCFY